jgi:hypothetical protein
MNKIRDEQELITQLASLPGEIAPQNDVWPAISERIERDESVAGAEARRFQLWPLATAASLLMVLAGGIYLNKPWQQTEHGAPLMEMASQESSSADSFYRVNPNMVGELEYQAAFKEFMALDPSSISVRGVTPDWIENGWSALRQVEIELLAAIKSEPDNDFLNLRMAALRGRQIDLLKQIASVDKTSRRNNS